jgi:GrpB-like predicted nucleotidyltransferase (UPF0157 family)
VPGLKAKPIIDVLLVVRDLVLLDGKSNKLVGLGYKALGEYGLPGRRYFVKRVEGRSVNLHAFQEGNAKEIGRHLAVRDFLRAHPEVAEKYGRLKEQLARSHPEDLESYMDGKDAFVKDMERRALEWQADS